MYVPVTTTTTVLFDPATGAKHAVLNNPGNTTVYLGGPGVTAARGFPLLPGQQVAMPIATQVIYGVTGPGQTGTNTNTTNAAVAAGATALPVTSGGASFTAGMLVQVGSGNTAEVVTAGAGSTATSIVISALRFDHATGAAITQVLGGTGGSVHVTVGS